MLVCYIACRCAMYQARLKSDDYTCRTVRKRTFGSLPMVTCPLTPLPTLGVWVMKNKMAKKKKSAKVKTAAPQQRAVVTTAPAAVGTKIKGAMKPNVSFSDVGCTVTHTEYCFDITATTGAGTGKVERINPQRASVFTWLSALATRFEMYRFRRLKFHYKPSVGTSNDGYVLLGFDFDAYDVGVDGSPTPASKPEMLAWKYSSKCAVWQSTTLDVTPDSRLATMRYCDFNYRGDARLDILGNLEIRAASDVEKFVGEIFVEYTVEFRQPSYKVPPSLYQTWENPSNSAFNDWFAVRPPTGNIFSVPSSNHTLYLYDVGKFLVDMIVHSSVGDIASNNVLTVTAPAGTEAQWNLTNTAAFHSAADAFSQYVLEVLVPPVILNATGMSGNALASAFRIATYVK